MRLLLVSLGTILLVGAFALIELDSVLLLAAQVPAQELKDWITETGPNTVTLLFGLAAVLLVAAALGKVFTTRAQWRRDRQSDEGRMAPENAHEVDLARWIKKGQHLFNRWQKSVERLDQLQRRLAATALEIDQLRAHVIYLSQEGEALLLERDHLRSTLARMSELIQRACEVQAGSSGAVAPEVGA